MRAVALCLAFLWFTAPAAAQEAAEMAQMRLYIQQLQEQLRQLTGQNEQLIYELNQLRAQTGQAPAAPAPGQPALAAAQPAPVPVPSGQALDPALAAPAQDLGSISISPDDPLISPDGFDTDGPVDLSTMAGGAPGAPLDPGASPVPAQPGLPANAQTAGLPDATAPPTPGTGLSGAANDEYNLAYGYILTGDYDLAEQSFQNWLAAFPQDAQAGDARFWLGESHYQQGEYREAANAFLAVYKSSPDSSKGPDALLKLGVSLSALGEKTAACATLAEVARKFPQASAAVMSRVGEEQGRAGCS